MESTEKAQKQWPTHWQWTSLVLIVGSLNTIFYWKHPRVIGKMAESLIRVENVQDEPEIFCHPKKQEGCQNQGLRNHMDTIPLAKSRTIRISLKILNIMKILKKINNSLFTVRKFWRTKSLFWKPIREQLSIYPNFLILIVYSTSGSSYYQRHHKNRDNKKMKLNLIKPLGLPPIYRK